jgi:membrane-bound lytic murein transglycosylase B
MDPLTPRSTAARALTVAVGGTILVAVVTLVVSLALTPSSAPAVAGADLVAAPPAAVTVPLAPAAQVGTATGPAYAVSPAWTRRTAADAGIPEAAVRAYGTATLRMGRRDPSCGLGWTTLAGLGWVESQQGTIGGRVLGADGRADRPVFGPALDGAGDLAAVRAASGRWERAVGPLQFLPSTWDTWGSDGDGDGRADPQDLDDAAWAAARYLCASGLDLRTGAGWAAAVRSYNHSDAYVRAVYDAAGTYAARAG